MNRSLSNIIIDVKIGF